MGRWDGGMADGGAAEDGGGRVRAAGTTGCADGGGGVEDMMAEAADVRFFRFSSEGRWQRGCGAGGTGRGDAGRCDESVQVEVVRMRECWRRLGGVAERRRQRRRW